MHNYVKTLKMFCEITGIVIPWKKITRGLPRGRRYAGDRSPTIEEIHKIIEFPDRRIRPLVYTMASSRIRVGAWYYLKWGHVSPIIKEDDKLLAARIHCTLLLHFLCYLEGNHIEQFQHFPLMHPL
ncbi:MAG: hypothetical protein ACM3X1_03790 [Ignavibacteriales bacterium]